MKRLPLLLALPVVFTSLGPVAQAKKMLAPQSFQRASADGKFVLVILASSREDGRRDLREKYPRSGMYADGDPGRLLWPVSWYEEGRRVSVAMNGVVIVRQQSYLAFYAKETLLHTHWYNRLADSTPRGSPHAWAEDLWLRETMLDDANTCLRVTMHDGNRFVFDLATASILEEARPAREQEKTLRGRRWWLGLFVLVGFLMMLGLAFAVWRELARPRKLRPSDATGLP